MKLDKFTTVEGLAAAIRTLISKNFVATSRITVNDFMSLGTPTELTISGGEITVTKSFHIIDTESDDITDDLDTINGGSNGDILVLRSADASRDPTVKDGTGNIATAGDFTLTGTRDMIVLMYDQSQWIEISRSDNT